MKKLILGLVITFGFSSCEDYIAEVNTEQSNRANFDLLAPNQMLAGALVGYTAHQNITLASYGNRMAYVSALNSGFTATDPAYTYAYSSSSYSNIFESGFLIADNFQDILDKKTLFPLFSYHYGVARIFKVINMDYLTALYGDVPYSQAFKDDVTFPKYDDDKTIVPKLLQELDAAREDFSNPVTGHKDLGIEDVVFGGDVAKWFSFANTIELRLLMRLSKTTDPALVALRTARFAALTQDFITEDVTVNPGYNMSGAFGQRNPIFRVHGLIESNDAFTSTNLAYATGIFISQLLNGTLVNSNINCTGIIDPRRPGIVSTTVGATQGTFPLTAVSRYSSFYTGRRSTISANDANINASERDAYLMLAAESYFLQAEAVARGYMSGSAQFLFNDGINASFAFYTRSWGTYVAPALSASASTYISATNARNGLGWGGSANKINAIITQKYLALAQWNGIEQYLDHMRTGFPVLPFPVGAEKPNRPNRLIYPPSEYSSNSQNVPNVSNDDIFTVNTKTPYYLQ